MQYLVKGKRILLAGLFLQVSFLICAQSPSTPDNQSRQIKDFQVDYLFVGADGFINDQALNDFLTPLIPAPDTESLLKTGARIMARTSNKWLVFFNIATFNISQAQLATVNNTTRQLKFNGFEYGFGLGQSILDKGKFRIDLAGITGRNAPYIRLDQFSGTTFNQIFTSSNSVEIRHDASYLGLQTAFSYNFNLASNLLLNFELNAGYKYFLQENGWRDTVNQNSVDAPFFEDGAILLGLLVGLKIPLSK